jgi:pectinesterase
MYKRRGLRVVLLSLLLMGCYSTATPQANTPAGAPVVRESDIVYGKADDLDLKLDLVRPATGGPFPAVIFLFGGGFSSGSRGIWIEEITNAAQRGYVGVAPDYRLTSVFDNTGKPRYPFPSQVHDVKCTVRWLRVNARQHAIDPDRIGVVGYSAGGSLSLMLALTEVSDGLEGPCESSASSRVQVAVNIAGPTDFVRNHEVSSDSVEQLLGGRPEKFPDRYIAASPITYVGGQDAPVLTICGSYDPRLQQQQQLDDRMRAAGSVHTLIVVQGTGHSLYGLVNFDQDNPVWSFLDKLLMPTR